MAEAKSIKPCAKLPPPSSPENLRTQLQSWEALIILGQENTGTMPFDALVWDDDQYIGERFVVSHLPSFPIGLWLKQNRVSSPHAPDQWQVQVFSHLPTAQFPDRVMSQIDLDLLFADSPPHRFRSTSSAEATFESFAESLSAQTHLLQLFAHGTVDDQGRPALRFADRISPLSSFPESGWPETVILTSCESARAPLRRGDDGSHHLNGLLFRGGARLYMSSLTEIDYEASLQLLAGFYQGVMRGSSPAHSLREARRQQILPKDGIIHPVHNMLFQLQGMALDPLVEGFPEAHFGTSQERTSLLWIWVTLGVIAGVFSAWFLR